MNVNFGLVVAGGKQILIIGTRTFGTEIDFFSLKQWSASSYTVSKYIHSLGKWLEKTIPT